MTPTINASVTEDDRQAIAVALLGRYYRDSSIYPRFAVDSDVTRLLDALVRERRKVAVLREALHAASGFLPPDAEESGYGNFPGGDPRTFSPDPECSTPEEREAHRLACERWDDGETEAEPGYCTTALSADRDPVQVAEEAVRSGANVAAVCPDGSVRIVRQRYGLGSYMFRDPDLAALHEQIAAALDTTGEP